MTAAVERPSDLSTLGPMLFHFGGPQNAVPGEAASVIIEIERDLLRPIIRATSLQDYSECVERIWQGREALLALFGRIDLAGSRAIAQRGRRDDQAFLKRVEQGLQRVPFLGPAAKDHMRSGLRHLRIAWAAGNSGSGTFSLTDEQMRFAIWSYVVSLWAFAVASGDRPACDEVADELAISFENMAEGASGLFSALAQGTQVDDDSLEDRLMSERLRRERLLRPGDFESTATLEEFAARNGNSDP